MSSLLIYVVWLVCTLVALALSLVSAIWCWDIDLDAIGVWRWCTGVVLVVLFCRLSWWFCELECVVWESWSESRRKRPKRDGVDLLAHYEVQRVVKSSDCGGHEETDDA